VLERWIIPLASRLGVRVRLSLVALIAIAPLLALLLAAAMQDRRLTLQSAQTRAQDLARLGVEQQDDVFRRASDALTFVSRMPVATTVRPAACHSTMQAIGIEFPQFTSIGFTDENGKVVCSSGSAKVLPDIEVWQRAMSTSSSRLVVGRFHIGPISGKPIIAAAKALIPDVKDGPPPGVAYVTLNLERAAEHARDFAGATNATLTLVDVPNATILLRSPDAQNISGKALKSAPLLAAMREHSQGGSIEAEDFDGTPMVFGFAPVAVGVSQIMVTVGLSRAVVLADADHRFLLGVSFALVTALAAAYAAWLLGDCTQLRPIRALVETARRLGGGDLAARTNMAKWQAPEFRALGTTLGEMAQSIAGAQAKLEESERQLRLLAENATDMIVHLRRDGRRLYTSPACRTLLGWEPEEMLQITPMEAIHPDDAGALARLWAVSPGPRTATFRMRRKDGSYVWVESALRDIPVSQGQLPECIAVVRDIDSRIAAERRLKQSEERYRLLAEHSTDMVFQLDADMVHQYVSPACREVLGYPPEEMVGSKPFDHVPQEDVAYLTQEFRSILCGEAERTSVVCRARHRNGRWIWVEAHLRGLVCPASGEVSGIIGALRDISVRKNAEDRLAEANRQLEVLAAQDALTGLANRRTFDEALSREYRRSLRERSHLGLVMIDVDRFKSLNDRYGHPVGDECLRRVSGAIASVLRRSSDLAARYGGEEFAVLLPGTDETGTSAVAEQIRLTIMALAIEHADSPDHVMTVSVGVAALASNGPDGGFESLVQAADRALYAAKDSGRNTVVCAYWSAPSERPEHPSGTTPGNALASHDRNSRFRIVSSGR
jgi:diguanylate cyclase (GGDEF)-like protein/PAS domain S-box-containing protein